MSRIEKDQGLGEVFTFTGDAVAPAQTQSGPAPPLVTGSFGPLDIVESILGELDDKLATGTLSQLTVRLPEKGSKNLGSTVDGLLAALQKIPFLPADLRNGVQSLKSSSAATGQQTVLWTELNKNPSGIWDAIEPFFRIRDDIVRWLQDTAPDLKFLTEPIAALSNAIDEMLFAALANIVGPILGNLRNELEKMKEDLLRTQKAAAKNEQSNIFEPGSTASNPSHSQIAKDHFDCILNIPAGQCNSPYSHTMLTYPFLAQASATVVRFTTNEVISCWEKWDRNPDQAIDNILQTLHHPFDVDLQDRAKNPLRYDMFSAVRNWWTAKDLEQRQYLQHRLQKSTIADSQHKIVIHNPGTWHNEQAFGKKPTEDKSVVDTIIDNLKNIEDIPSKLFGQFVQVITKSPTSQDPNPVDKAIGMLPVAVPITQILQNVPQTAFLASAVVGNVLKSIFSW